MINAELHLRLSAKAKRGMYGYANDQIIIYIH